MKPSTDELLVIYRTALKRYEQEGDAARIRVQRSLIARLEATKQKEGV